MPALEPISLKRSDEIPALHGAARLEKIESTLDHRASAMPGLKPIASGSTMPGLKPIAAAMPGLKPIESAMSRLKPVETAKSRMPGLKRIESESQATAKMPGLKLIETESQATPKRPALKPIETDSDMPSLTPVAQRTQPAMPKLVSIKKQALVDEAKPAQIWPDRDARRAPTHQAVNTVLVGESRGRPVLKKLNDFSAVSDSLEWLDTYINKNQQRLESENLVFFAPSNNITNKLKSAAAARGKIPATETLVQSHLAELFGSTVEGRTFESQRNSDPIRVDNQLRILQPQVSNSQLTYLGEKQFGEFNVRVYSHENVFKH